MLGIFKKKDLETSSTTGTNNINANKSEVNNSTNNESISTNNNSINSTNKQESSLSPPKNLPELAKDIYGGSTFVGSGEQEGETPLDNQESAKHETYLPTGHFTPNSSFEPKSSEVPHLDLSLIKSRLLHNNSLGDADRSNISSDNAVNLRNNAQNTRSINENTIQQTRQSSTNATNREIVYHNTSSHGLLTNELFMLIKNRKLGAAKQILSGNMLQELEMYHSGYSNITDLKLQELKNLEITWITLNKKFESINAIKDVIGVDFSNKSKELQYSLDDKAIESNDYSFKKNSRPAHSDTVFNKTPDIFNQDFMQVLKKTEDIHSKFFNIIIEDNSKFFYCTNGLILKSITDLMNALSVMPDAVFSSHVNFSKNDFANWIRYVIGDVLLADMISEIYNRDELLRFLRELN